MTNPEVASQKPAPIPEWPKWCEEGDHPYFAISNGPTEYKCIICHLYEENDRLEAALRGIPSHEAWDGPQCICDENAPGTQGYKHHWSWCKAARAALSTPLGTPGRDKP